MNDQHPRQRVKPWPAPPPDLPARAAEPNQAWRRAVERAASSMLAALLCLLAGAYLVAAAYNLGWL